MNLYEKLSAITTEITAVAKNLNVGFGKNQYKAVGEADVLAAVKPIEAKHKVYSYPADREIVESGILTSVRADGSESKQQYMRIRTTYRFIDMEDPAQFIDIISYSDGVDSQDKAPGKAMTYGDKYALLKAYKIITGDDPDQEYSKPLKEKAAVSTREKAATNKITPVMVRALSITLEKNLISFETIKRLYNVEQLSDLTQNQHDNIVRNIEKIKQKQEENE